MITSYDNSRTLEQYPDYLRPEDVCCILGLGKSSIYKYLKSGELKSAKLGGLYRIPKHCLVDFVESRM